MTREEWDILRKLDRKVGYITEVCRQVEGNQAAIDALTQEVCEIQEVLVDFRKILKFRATVKKCFRWGITVLFAAALTTYVNLTVTAYVNKREVPAKPPITVVKAHGSAGK